MEFILSKQHVSWRKLFKNFAEKEITPHTAKYDESGEFPDDIVKKLAKQGFMGIPVPKEYGGAGADFLTYILFLEEISCACASLGVILAVHTSVGTFPILYYGNEEQKKYYVPKLAAGEFLGAFAITEPGAGSDASKLRTTARLAGDEYILNGTKTFITSSGHADVYTVFATINKEMGNKGITAFLVDKNAPGFKIGTIEKKMGLNASSTGELIFEDCRIPTARRLGKEGEGFKIAMSLLDGGRVGIAAQGLGISQSAFNIALDFARTKQQNGKVPSEFQTICLKLSKMATRIEAARLLVYQAAFYKDANLPCSKLASMAKMFATDCAMSIATEAVQILGYQGYNRRCPVERLMRDAKATQIYEGTNQIQRLVIAKALEKE